MNALRLGTGFTLVKAAPAVILPRMTAGSGTGQSQTSAKYVLLLVVVVLAPVIFTWLTSAPDRGDTDFDQLLEAGKTHYEAGQAQQAIDAFARALKAKRTETDLLLNLANAHRLANQPAEVIKYAMEALAIDVNLGAGHFLVGCAHLRLDQPTEAIQALQQAYDIDFTAARFDDDGKKTKGALITVKHNGVVIHDYYELKNKTGAGQKESPMPLPILLQNHGNPVRFRNYWILEK